jgi:subfamily B ATP-binding cassette protein MsbA
MPADQPSIVDPVAIATWPIYRRLLNYSLGYWPLLLAAILAMAVDAICTSGFTLMMKPLLDDGFLAKDMAVIAWLPMLVTAIFIGRGLASFAAEYTMSSVGRSVIRDLRQELFEKYLRLPARYYDRNASGQMISRLTFNIDQVAEASTHAITVVFRDTFYIIGFVGVMLYNSVALTLATAVIGPVIALVMALVSRRFRHISGKIQKSMGEVTHRTAEIVAGHREVKIFGGHEREKDTFQRINNDNRRQNLKLVATKAASASLVQMTAGVALAGIVYLATIDSMLKEISPGSFASFMTAMLAILPSLKKLTSVLAMIQKGVAAADSIFEVIDGEEEQSSGDRSLQRARGDIRFRDVSLDYGSNGQPALDGLNLDIPHGSVTAIVGRSGAGKTSLVSLLARFYEPSSGVIELDGHPISDYALGSLRDQIAFVSQNVVLFDESLSANIAYGKLSCHDPEAIRQAAARANANEFIEELPDGFETLLGEGGVQLSGGQRQRVAIARAILKDAPILILDEATSALDTESERAIQAALEEVMRKRTTLVIAHRLSTVENADQVVVLSQGRVVEQGTHQELLARGGHYASLYEMQFRDEPQGNGPPS